MLNEFKYRYPSAYNNFGKSYEEDQYPTVYEPREYAHVCRYKNTPTLLDKTFSAYYHQFGQSFAVDNISDTYHKVDIKTENRLDIIALQYYSNPTMWWVIASANNILDVFNVPAGTVLRIPSLQSIYQIGGVLG